MAISRILVSAEADVAKRRSRRRGQWCELIETLEQSGENCREFAAARGLDPSTAAWWRSKPRREARAELFVTVEVEVADSEPVRLGRLEVRLPFGIVLAFEESFDTAGLRGLMATLMGPT